MLELRPCLHLLLRRDPSTDEQEPSLLNDQHDKPTEKPEEDFLTRDIGSTAYIHFCSITFDIKDRLEMGR